MLGHTKKHHTKKKTVLYLSESGKALKLPLKVSESLGQYVIKNNNYIDKMKAVVAKLIPVSSGEVFRDINKKYTKAGALLKAIRIREGLNQKDFANLLGVEQGDLSKMERGKRAIGKTIAQRIGKKFDIDYRLFL